MRTDARSTRGLGARKMAKRILTASVALAVAVSALVVGPMAAHTYSPSHYNAGCNTGNDAYNAQSYVHRPTSGTASYKGVRGTVNVVALYPCTHYIDRSGWSLVNAANGTGPGGSWGQFGYAQQGCFANLTCQNGFADSVRDFWWTAVDGNGQIYAATWIDFNNDGVHDAPAAGASYRMQITYQSSTWRYCVTRISDGLYDCTDINRNGGYFDTAWYGFEVWNDASALGNRDVDSDINLTPMEYLNSNGSIYTTITNNPGQPACIWVVQGQGVHWNSEHCVVSGGSGTNTINAYTAYHS